MNAAAKVGLFVVVFVALVTGAFSLLGSRLVDRRKVYYAEMPDAAGLNPGTRVLLAGVVVGNLTKVELTPELTARLTIALRPEVQLSEGSTVRIAASLVGLGDTPLLIVPPAERTGLTTMAEGTTMQGSKAGPLDALLPDGGKSAYAELTGTLKAVRKLLEDKGLIGQLKQLLTTTEETIRTSQGTLTEFGKLASRGNDMLAQSQGDLIAMLKTTRSTLQDASLTVAEIRKFAQSGKLQQGTEGLLDRANQIGKRVDGLLVSLDKTLNDPELQGSLKTLAKNSAEASNRLPELSDSAAKIAKNVETITAKSTGLPDQIGELMTKAAKLEDQLSAVLERVQGYLPKPGSGPKIPPITGQMDLLRESEPGRWRTDLNASVPIGQGSTLHFGFFDAFESNRLNLQVGRPLNSRLGYRYGVFASRPSFGVDYQLAPRLSLRGDVFDINKPRFDSRLRYDLGNGLTGWLGVDRIFSENSLLVGVGIRR